MISEEELLKSLSRQLKYYIDVKRLENGFNTTTSRYQQPAATSLTPLPRASRSSPVRAPSATSRATKGSQDDSVAREREIQRSLKQRMDNHQFLSSPYVNPYIEEERRRYLRQQNAQLLSRRSQKTGYRMVTRSPEPRATRMQTERLIDTASKLLVAIEGADRKKREPNKDDRSKSSLSRQSSRENYKTDSDDDETGRRDYRRKEDSTSGHRRRKKRSTSTQTKTRPPTANPGHDDIRSQSDLLHSRSPSRNARGTQTTVSPYESAVRTDSRKKKIHRDRSRSPSSLHSRSPRGGAKTTKPVNRTASSSHSRSPHGGVKTKLVSHKAVDTRSLSDGDSRRMAKERKSHSRSTSASRKHDRSERKVNAADNESRTRSSSEALRETNQTKIRVPPQLLSRSTSPIVFPQSSHKGKGAVGKRELRGPKQRVEPQISHSTPRPDEQSNQQLAAKPLSQQSSAIKHVETRTRDDYYETDFGGRIRTDRTNHERRKVRPAAEGKGKLQPITTSPDQNVVKPASQRKSSNGKAASEVKEKEPSVVIDAASESDKADGRSVTGSQGTRQSNGSKTDLRTETPPDNVETKSAVSRHSTVPVGSDRSVQRPQSAVPQRKVSDGIEKRSNASIGDRSQRTVTSRGERDVEPRSRSSSSSSSTTTIASDKSYSESFSDSGSSTERSVKVKSSSSQQIEVHAGSTDDVANSNDTAAYPITDEVKKTIHEAFRAGDLKLVDEMLTSQPDLIKSYDNDGLTPLLVAASNGQFDVIAFMVNKFPDAIDLDYRGFTDRAAIHLAAESGQCDCLRILFKLGASVDLQTTEGRTALHFAAIKGDMQCVKFLADDCYAEDVLDNDGKSAADLAKERGHTDIAVYLQSAFSERRAINRPSADAAGNDNHEDGDSPGHSDDNASEQRVEPSGVIKDDDDDDKDESGSDEGGLFDRTSKTSVVDLRDDEPPSAEDGTGQGHGRANSASPARVEDNSNNSDIDSERSSRTSRSESPDKDKESEKSISEEDPSDAMSQAAGADDEPELPRGSAAADIQSVRQATQRGDLAQLKSLLTSQPDLLNQRDDDGLTLLHCAVINSQFDVVVYLIELASLDLINARSNTGQTAMQLAAKNGLVDYLKELHRAEANHDVKTDDGYTALHLAAQAGHLNAVMYLVEECHVANIEDQHDLLAADLARANGHVDIVQYLQEKFNNTDSFTPELS